MVIIICINKKSYLVFIKTILLLIVKLFKEGRNTKTLSCFQCDSKLKTKVLQL